MKKQAVAVVKQKKVAVIQGNSPADMIRAAAEGKLDLDKLEKYLNMQKEFDATQAEKLFNSAFTKAQAEIEGVVKTKDNPHTKSKYADLGAVIESAKPVYTKHGFAIIFYEGEAKATDNVRVCADVLHEAGHKETYHYDIPLDGVGIQGNANMTKIHGKSSSVAYGRRYLMCMIWNIPTLDNDGNGSQKPVVVKPETKPAVAKSESNPEVKPVNLTGKDGGNPTTTKGL
ncbi:MAG: ERF family protein, partial [Saccharofermentanaceae bacterium]